MDKLGKSKKYREWRAECRNRNRHKKRQAAKQSKTCSDCKEQNTFPERSRDIICTDFEEKEKKDGK